ncbi:MAG TPA: tetratricopeptide repeat protein [Methylomirabilota bacterium]|nr:tetratricopeptide repeat protein [Methylomirabilota bacterium]
MGRLAALVLLAVTLSACGNPAPSPQAEYDVVAEALKAFDKSDWAQAARLLREAIVKQPMNLRLHYSLGVAVTHLELREEAIREFRWVLGNAPGTPEAQAARNWLIAAGALSPDADATASGSSESSQEASKDPDRGNSFVRGQVTWNEGQPPISLTRLQLFLKGLNNTPTKEVQLVLRTDEEGRFEFKNVPAGTYKLTNRIAGQPLWRVKIDVPPGQTTSVDLTPQNSLRVRDDFPDAN